MTTPFQSPRLAVLYVMPQGWRYFEGRAGDLDELEAAFWAPAPTGVGAALRNLDRQAGQRLTRAVRSGEVSGVVLVGSAEDHVRLSRLLPEGVRAKVAARLDPPYPGLSREELAGLLQRALPSLVPVAEGQ